MTTMKATGIRAVMVACLMVAAAVVYGPRLGAAPQAPTPQAPQTTPPPVTAHTSEANLQLPDLGTVSFHGMPGDTLLMLGLIVCGLGLIFGLVIMRQLKAMAVHASMLEVSELIYETCKTYLIQ